MIAVLGTGAIGGAVVRRLLGAGVETIVWNRTAGRAAGLGEAGARVAATPGEAVAGSEMALLTLTGYDAVGEVVDSLGAGGPTVVALCTGTPAGARAAGERAAAKGLEFLAGGVQASPETIGTDRATVLYGGDRAVFDRHRPTLELLGRAQFAGRSPEAAAVWDLALFGVWYDAQLGLLRALRTARAAGIDLETFAAAAGGQLAHVVDAGEGVVAELAQRDYPAGPASLDEHLTVLRYLCELRAGHPIGDGGLDAVIARIEAIGTGHRGLTALIDAEGL